MYHKQLFRISPAHLILISFKILDIWHWRGDASLRLLTNWVQLRASSVLWPGVRSQRSNCSWCVPGRTVTQTSTQSIATWPRWRPSNSTWMDMNPTFTVSAWIGPHTLRIPCYRFTDDLFLPPQVTKCWFRRFFLMPWWRPLWRPTGPVSCSTCPSSSFSVFLVRLNTFGLRN